MRIPARLRGPIAFWALAGLALLVSHDAVFLAQIGPGETLTAALRTAGHDYWGTASILLIVTTVLVGAATLIRLFRLTRHAASLGATPSIRTSRLARLMPTWARLAVIVIVGFALQENVEHAIAHGHLIGVRALLGPEYPLALPVLGIVSFVAALGAAVLVASERALVAAIRAALAARLRPTRLAIRPSQRVPASAASVLARFVAGRAPPWMLQLPGNS